MQRVGSEDSEPREREEGSCIWNCVQAPVSLSFKVKTSLVAQTLKHLLTMRETWVQSLGQEDLLEKGMATHSSILAATTSAKKKKQLKEIFRGFPGGSEVKASACNVGDQGSIPGSGRFPWRKQWQPTPVFLPGESQGTVRRVAKSQTRLSDFTSLHFKVKGFFFSLPGLPWVSKGRLKS